jgi:sirohydrochlorin cobaltochelatase
MSSASQRAALIIVGHGSTVNPDSSAPTHQHADEIQRRGLFAEVVCAFWKEEPSMREVFYMVESDLIFIVPNFISEGYFTREVLPRELRLDGPITRRDGKTICYCDPVGLHPSMTPLLLHRAAEAAPGVPRDQTSLIIVGHGTSLNENSRKAIETQTALIREGGHGFAEVLDAYMEEAPFVAKWHEMASAPNVIVVPFFIADGLHSYQDIPVLLGIESEPTAAASQNEIFRRNPYTVRGRKLYYSSAVGTDAGMADVILDQVRDFGFRNSDLGFRIGGERPVDGLETPQGKFVIGQVSVEPQADGSWWLHHLDDSSSDKGLEEFRRATDARTIATYDATGEFRPLKTAPNLKRGWILKLASEREMKLALDFLYPAMLEFWKHWRENTLQPVTLRETLGRQTGMYRFANTIADEQAQDMIACECDPKTKCLRRITWKLDAEQPLALPSAKIPPQLGSPHGTGADAAEIPLLCVEACTLVVSAAREIARRNQVAEKSGKA